MSPVKKTTHKSQNKSTQPRTGFKGQQKTGPSSVKKGRHLLRKSAKRNSAKKRS